MKPVFDRAKADPKRVVYAEGEEDTILRAVQTVVDEGLARPILIGRPDVIEAAHRAARPAPRGRTRLRAVQHPLRSALRRLLDTTTTNLMERRGVTPALAKSLVRSRSTLIAALMVERGEADAMICGLVGRYHEQACATSSTSSALDQGVVLAVGDDRDGQRQGHVLLPRHPRARGPDAEQIAEATLQAALRLKLFGIEPRIALLSHSNFGSRETPNPARCAQALQIIRERVPRPGGRRRDAGRPGAGPRVARAPVPEFPACRTSQHVRVPEPRRRQHRLQHDAR